MRINQMCAVIILGACLIVGYGIGWAVELPSKAEAAIVKPVVAVVEPQAKADKLYLGQFVVTGYCSCKQCCGKWSNPSQPTTASGTIATAGRTVGADWGTIPAGTNIYIEGYGCRIVEDKPAKWIINKYDGMIIDLYCKTHAEAMAVGWQQVMIWEVVQ